MLIFHLYIKPIIFLMLWTMQVDVVKSFGFAIRSISSYRTQLIIQQQAKMNPRTLLALKSFTTKRKESKLGAADEVIPERPYTLPPGQFRPKQSLGQNYLSDQNYVHKIVDAFVDARSTLLDHEDKEGHRVIEIGPGIGALTRVLFSKYPKMTAIEIDQRAVAFLNEKLPRLQVIHQDILKFQYDQHLQSLPTGPSKVSIIANLPYYIVSQVLFGLADASEFIDIAVVTMQWEVGERICADINTKAYGIPSVIFQLYADTKILFKIPPKVFYPVPKVDSALLRVDFTKPHPELNTVYPDQLRKVVTAAFRQRRKMMRQSLKDLILSEKLILPEHWATRRPESLTPGQFLELTRSLYAGRLPGDNTEESKLAAEKQKKNTWRASLTL